MRRMIFCATRFLNSECCAVQTESAGLLVGRSAGLLVCWSAGRPGAVEKLKVAAWSSMFYGLDAGQPRGE